MLRAQRSLRQAKASRQPICVHISDVAERHYSFRAATINGVRYGPSDLRAPRELYRFGWEHERLLWIGCIVSETFRVVGGGQKPCFAVMPCLLGMLTPELVHRIIGIAYERTHPECDPVLLRSLRGMPLEVVDKLEHAELGSGHADQIARKGRRRRSLEGPRSLKSLVGRTRRSSYHALP